MPDLLARLKPSLEDMLQTMMFNNPTYLPHVQVMILWAVWPLPNLRSWNDKTLLVISAAVSHAMQLGLHRPGFEDEYSRMGFFVRENLVENERSVQPASAQKVFRSGAWCDDPDEQEAVRRERTKTWLALITTYQSTRPTVDQIRQPDIAPELIYYQKLSNLMQYAKKNIDELGLVHQGKAEEFHMSRMKLERQLAAIEIGIVNPSRMIALQLQSSELYLRMMYFLDDDPSERRNQALLTLYETASELIFEYILGHDAAYDQLPSSPLSTARWIFCAAWVLLRVSCSSLGARVDTKVAKLAYNAAAFAIRKLAVSDKSGNDLLRIPTRLAGILRALWRKAERDPFFFALVLRD
ncbi:Regulatory protein leu3 [Diaporthe eres]